MNWTRVLLVHVVMLRCSRHGDKPPVRRAHGASFFRQFRKRPLIANYQLSARPFVCTYGTYVNSSIHPYVRPQSTQSSDEPIPDIGRGRPYIHNSNNLKVIQGQYQGHWPVIFATSLPAFVEIPWIFLTIMMIWYKTWILYIFRSCLVLAKMTCWHWWKNVCPPVRPSVCPSVR